MQQQGIIEKFSKSDPNPYRQLCLFVCQTIEGREVNANITEKPIESSASSPDLSLLQSEDSTFVDSPYKVYVGNLAKTVTKEMLENLFSEKGKVVSAKVSRVPGTSKSTGFGFVTFSSDEDVEAAILDLNNSLLELDRRFG